MGNLQKFGQVDFLGALADQAAVEDEFGGIALVLDEGFEPAINGALTEDHIDIYRLGAVHAVNAAEGLDEFVIRPRIGYEDDIVGEVEAVAFGHALDTGEHYGDGRGVLTALLEDGGLVTAALLADAAIEDHVADIGLGEPA